MDKIRWGRGYLTRLLEQAPANTAEIQRVSSAIIGDILEFDDGVELYAKSLARLSSALEEPAKRPENNVLRFRLPARRRAPNF